MVEIMGRRERKKLQSKQTILAAAVSQFMAKGVRETSIADIMGTAKLGIGTFYNYFESKEALLLCLLEQIVEEARETSRDMMEKKRSAADTLSAVMLKTAEKLDANRFVLPLFLSVADSIPDEKNDAPAKDGSGLQVGICGVGKIRAGTRRISRRDFSGTGNGDVPFHLPGGFLQLAALFLHGQRAAED